MTLDGRPACVKKTTIFNTKIEYFFKISENLKTSKLHGGHIEEKELSIKDYFTPPMQKDFGGSICMFCLDGKDENKKSLNIYNSQGVRLFKIIAKSEGDKSETGEFAQIKIIPMKARKVLIYKNMPSDPEPKNLPRFRDFEITYHGPTSRKKTPITHISEIQKSGKKIHKTLINKNFPINKNSNDAVSIISFFEGNIFDNPKLPKEISEKSNAHNFKTPINYRSRIDVYASSSEADINSVLEGHYFFSFLFSPDYVLSSLNHPLIHTPISSPINIFRVKDYLVWVRCTVSEYRGRPYIQLFSNEKYYENFSNRVLAWKGSDGEMVWSTIKEEEEKLKNK